MNMVVFDMGPRRERYQPESRLTALGDIKDKTMRIVSYEDCMIEAEEIKIRCLWRGL